jgi:uncharacterized membrane protein YoaK (UPF0700 family)
MTLIAVVLTFASGASDVASFTRLGGVFTSVMTGNMTVFGLALARRSASLAAHTGVAFAGYVAGVVLGTRIGWHFARRRPDRVAAKAPGGDWPPQMTLTMLVEVALIAGVVIGWELSGSRPAGVTQFVILAMSACAMGIQSAAVNQMGLGNVSTTFLTGTLTGLVTAITTPDRKRGGLRRPSVLLLGLVAGAVLAGVLLYSAPDVVPLLTLAGVCSAVALGSRSAGSRRPRRSGEPSATRVAPGDGKSPSGAS